MANEELEPRPRITSGNVIKPEDVRHFIMDRSVEDNMLHLDLYFDEQEIMNAMRFACMEFNSIHPLVIKVTPERMPFNIVYLYGIVYHLYLSKLQQLGRNDITYDAGGVSTTISKDEITFIKEMLPYYKDQFVRGAKQMKQHANNNSMFGIFC